MALEVCMETGERAGLERLHEPGVDGGTFEGVPELESVALPQVSRRSKRMDLSDYQNSNN
jgi:hypothetical protein